MKRRRARCLLSRSRFEIVRCSGPMDDVKSLTLKKLEDAVSQGLVDEEVVPLLFSINSNEGLVTTSSCSGRYQLISVPKTGDKVRSRILGKWHRPVTKPEIWEAISDWDGDGELHLLVQPLLLHVRAVDIKTGARLRNTAQECGLKFSTIRSVKLDQKGEVLPWGVVVEILGTERMEIPIDGIDKDSLENCLGPWIEKGNELVSRTKLHIDEMIDLLKDET